MKCCKISFLTSVGILAISFTISQTKMIFSFTKSNLTSADNCFSVITYKTANCSISDSLIEQVTDCETAISAQGLPVSLATGEHYPCIPEDNTVFCCATLEQDTRCSPFDPEGELGFNRYKIDEIYCKTVIEP
jgi:hypothetical protein